MAVFHKKPASQIVEQTLASNAERAQQAISKAQNEIARAKKLAHKSLAVVDKARSIQAKKRT